MFFYGNYLFFIKNFLFIEISLFIEIFLFIGIYFFIEKNLMTQSWHFFDNFPNFSTRMNGVGIILHHINEYFIRIFPHIICWCFECTRFGQMTCIHIKLNMEFTHLPGHSIRSSTNAVIVWVKQPLHTYSIYLGRWHFFVMFISSKSFSRNCSLPPSAKWGCPLNEIYYYDYCLGCCSFFSLSL